LTDYDNAVYLFTVFAANPDTYKSRLHDALIETVNNEPVFEYAPIFGQEYPVKMAYAYYRDAELFNAMLAAMPHSQS
jgi:hypothetical protein